MAEAIGEFYTYHDDCAWAAVAMAAHKLAPLSFPLTGALVDRLTREAIAAGQAGPQGTSDYYNVLTMLAEWKMGYTEAAKYTGYSFTRAELDAGLQDGLGRNKPVILGYLNGQALPGDEKGLKGHTNVALRYGRAGIVFGDGDNPICIKQGRPVLYTLDNLLAAECFYAVTLESVPGAGPGGITHGAATAATTQQGFLPIAQGLDNAEAFQGFDLAHPGASFWANASAALLRTIFVLIGLLMLGAVGWHLVNKSQPQIQAAGQLAASVLPVAA